ncbi:hypothetical protein DSO57_1027857 [Entomophthora muscae]|uniref:Uncharacterized protein n=1 Tax=Entomophthora muscae TaxID=34485 RepID=A0ACC2T1I4_9FUNG|nr:hypothetical protein DSO57_1027857 [Entomophthora muscae]
MGNAPAHLKALYYHCALTQVHLARKLWILENKQINMGIIIQQWKLEVARHLERINKFGTLILGKFLTQCSTIANCQYIKYNTIRKRIKPIWRTGYLDWHAVLLGKSL